MTAPKNRFSLDKNSPPATGLEVLINTGPVVPGSEALPLAPQGRAAGFQPPERAQHSEPALDPMVAFEQRMVANFSARRNPLNITSAATPELKAKLAVIARIAEDTVGSRQFTESSIIRALVELLIEAHIDWRAVFQQLPQEQASRPVEALKGIITVQARP